MEERLEGVMGEIVIAVVCILLIGFVILGAYGSAYAPVESSLLYNSPEQELWVITHLIPFLAFITYLFFRVILAIKFPDSFGWLFSHQTPNSNS
ncbi:MAG: hypothetical protein MUP45_04710 [Candidatus Marinimicrobia bacterium]|nr:hypothetical protein [Candidatus Neomarinimicrobiota bacterium]